MTEAEIREITDGGSYDAKLLVMIYQELQAIRQILAPEQSTPHVHANRRRVK